MPAFELTVTEEVPSWVCQNADCEQEVAILCINRPSAEYLEEYPGIPESRWTPWSSLTDPPYCPFCGKKMVKPFASSRADILRQWDSYRQQIAEGDTSSAPRDWFESVLDNIVDSDANRWRNAVLELLALDFVLKPEHKENPNKALEDLIAWNVAIALDPKVSE